MSWYKNTPDGSFSVIVDSKYLDDLDDDIEIPDESLEQLIEILYELADGLAMEMGKKDES